MPGRRENLAALAMNAKPGSKAAAPQPNAAAKLHAPLARLLRPLVRLCIRSGMGFNGEAMRSLDAKMSKRSGAIKAFALSGKIGNDSPVAADLRGGRAQGNREVIYLQTNNAGALLRFTDTYTKAVGGQMVVAMEPPTSEPNASREGLINVRDFTVKGEAQLERVAAGAPNGTGNGVSFSALRAEFTRQNGSLTIRDGVVKGPMIGATIEGSIDYPGNQVCMYLGHRAPGG